ncbi:MAG: hypothetical protein IKM48_01800, partial [Clostridia bacterium]|nr:hypothetical protein [Clostridia bacterium]
ELNERKEDAYHDTYCPSNPKTYEVLFDILDEVCDVFEPEFINRTFVDTNRIFIARFDGQDRVLESYVTHNFGETYEKEQVIRRIPGDRGVKIWRPTVPIHAQDNMPVYWHEGTYTAHTGGWHCDVVMLVEYDD